MIKIYYSDNLELLAVAPIIKVLENRGYVCETSTDLTSASEIGVHVHHSNLFYDFESHRWKKPVSRFSIGILHDLFQDSGARGGYFLNDSWHIYDLGILPGPRWKNIASESLLLGAQGPKLGFEVGGWPKSDRFIDRKRLKNVFRKPRILVAAAWPGMRQIKDSLSQLDPDKYDVTIKIPTWRRGVAVDSPWNDAIGAGIREMDEAYSFASSLRGFKVADRDGDIFKQLNETDLVISNGSNVAYEALVMGIPSICVFDWSQPSGTHGQERFYPTHEYPGIALCESKFLGEVVARALKDASLKAATIYGKFDLVAKETIGKSAEHIANIIERILDGTYSPSVLNQTRKPLRGCVVPESALARWQDEFNSKAGKPAGDSM